MGKLFFEITILIYYHRQIEHGLSFDDQNIVMNRQLKNLHIL